MSNRQFSYIFKLVENESNAMDNAEYEISKQLEKLGFRELSTSEEVKRYEGSIDLVNDNGNRSIEVAVNLKTSNWNKDIINADIEIPHPKNGVLESETCKRISQKLSAEIQKAITGIYPTKPLEPTLIMPLKKIKPLKTNEEVLLERVCG